MNDFNKIIKQIDYSDENFEGWKYTEILYVKLDWLKTSVCDLEELADILEEAQIFIEKLQKLEN
tara:strand:- start:4586 stop:4777 length:192 start_codon:yes stop_codon:yes gene_type:complete